MYVAVKGGEKAIANAHRLLAEERRGDPGLPDLSIDQIREQLSLAVDRVMAEGSLYDADLAALAVKQARGDQVEAVFLLRAYRTTLPRLAVSRPLDTSRMSVRRRISGAFKDLPGGQVLGPTFDYTHRLLDFSLTAADSQPPTSSSKDEAWPQRIPKAVDILDAEGLMEKEEPPEGDPQPPDLTRDPLILPAGRAVRLQALARGDEGFILSLAYATQRGFGASHPFVGEIRYGQVPVVVFVEELGFEVEIGQITITECEMVNKFAGDKHHPPQFTRGYGLAFGYNERKAMAMSVVDRAMRADELGEAVDSPAQDQEFVLYHSDNVEASGFLQHLKLPHHVDFQADLVMVRQMRSQTETGEEE